ncbi:TPA: hypothetical protein J0U54_001098 [Enterococcus faecium]|uniref:hypothetical protein n=2 Tax=Enterococcus faecalis TaxID=1351 RepID=UPI00230227C5|nr:hypothetical protein [Enterococcus faecalis]HAZ0794178.1 hypothetical protein [Enterococcus faecium]HAZ0832588.1 hypothetical protein [Enterococcus faecium]HAZ0854590.1 hypothetical protein [Enterococcus faecium]HAZ0869905.1 hypothetical protein [Enterococcus faecium]HAZ0875081.1 hypothetical protein [Enterococcus faecium]
MEMMDDKKFYQQMERLKQETFWEFLSYSYRFFAFVPLLCLLDFLIYPHFSWWFILKLFLLLLSLFIYFYWIYVFYRRIARKRMISFLFFRLFFMYTVCNSGFMMIVMTNFYRNYVEKEVLLYHFIGAVVFGIIVGVIYAGCSYERIKEYLKFNKM